MIVAISIVAVLGMLIFALTSIVCVSLFTQNKYGATHRLTILEDQFAAWGGEKRIDPKEVHDRLVALENRAGVMIGTRR